MAAVEVLSASTASPWVPQGEVQKREEEKGRKEGGQDGEKRDRTGRADVGTPGTTADHKSYQQR